MHARKPPIAHGDLTPSHILIDNHVNPCVYGFGLSGLGSLFQRNFPKFDDDAWLPSPDEKQDTPSADVLAFAKLTLFVSPALGKKLCP